MIHRHIWIFALMCCIGAGVAAPLRAEQKFTTAPACLYNSRSYSDGAYICVQKSLMLNCLSDGTKATWKIVADRDLNERCTSPVAIGHPPEPLTHSRRRHAIRHRIHPVAEAAAKCFGFNGRQYCE